MPLTLAAFSGYLYLAIAWASGTNVPGWVPLVLGAALVVLIGLAYFVGRRSYRRLQPEAAERAREELEVARTYLRHMVDFTGQLRESLTCPGIAERISRLEELRDLVFVAIAQGVNTLPGEYIRCALFEPADDNGETVLRASHYHGHTRRVEELKLLMSSVAGRAFTERRPIYVPDAATSSMLQRTTRGTHPVETLLCLPAYGWEGGRTAPIGVFSVTSNKPAAFSLSDRRFIYTCAEIIGLIAFFLRLFELVGRLRLRAVAEAEVEPGQTVIPPPPDEEEQR